MSLRLPPPLRVDTALGAIDKTAGRVGRRAARQGVSAVRQNVPVRTGAARKGVASRVARTITGYRIEVYASEKGRYRGTSITSKQVLRFLEGGTGPIIRPRRGHAFHLPSGWVSGAIRGQEAKHPFARAMQSDHLVVHELERGAVEAANAAERAL